MFGKFCKTHGLPDTVPISESVLAREAWVTKVSVEEVLFRVPVAKRSLRSAVQEEGLEQVTSVVLTPVVVT